MRCVLVGINGYKQNPLSGCVNDVLLMRHILTKYSVGVNDIRVLIDERATKAGIIERLEWLVKETFVHNKILFYFSGHGSYIPSVDYDGNNPEYTGKDQLICPVDMNWDGCYIKDDDIFMVLSKKNPSCKLIMVFDSCHSGSMYRQEYKDTDKPESTQDKPVRRLKIKTLRPPEDILCRIPSTVDLSSYFNSESNSSNNRNTVNIACLGINTKSRNNAKQSLNIPNTICISGCQDDQTSADAYFTNRYQGALSYSLQRFLYNEPKLSLTGLRTNTIDYLKSMGFEQTPEFTWSSDINSKEPLL